MAGEESFASLSFFIFALSRHFVQPCILILRDLPTPPSLPLVWSSLSLQQSLYSLSLWLRSSSLPPSSSWHSGTRITTPTHHDLTRHPCLWSSESSSLSPSSSPWWLCRRNTNPSNQPTPGNPLVTPLIAFDSDRQLGSPLTLLSQNNIRNCVPNFRVAR